MASANTSVPFPRTAAPTVMQSVSSHSLRFFISANILSTVAVFTALQLSMYLRR